MVFTRAVKTSIKRALTKSIFVIAIILAITSTIINAVFAAVDLRIPVEINWSDSGIATRPAQVILHVRRAGSSENLETSPIILTDSNEDPNNQDKWITTISGINYNSGYSYEIHQEAISDYTITQSANVSATTQLGIIQYAHQTLHGKKGQTYENTNFILISRNNSAPILWTLDGYDLNTLNTIIENTIGSGHTVSSYYNGASANIGIAQIAYDSGGGTVALNFPNGGSFDVYYGELGNIAQANTVSLTNTLSSVQHTLTVHHLNEDNTPFASDTVTSYQNGATYVASPITNNRYTPELTIGQATGTILQDIEVTYVYHPNFHNVVYQFAGSVLPPNASSLLPATAEYDTGTTVAVAANPTATGYRFLGWKRGGQDAGTSFTMPNEEVTLVGSWEQFNGYFAPSISKQVISPQSVYRFGDTVEFLITVSNTESYPISNVEVTENLAGARFLAASDYSVSSNGDVATIATIPANGSVLLYAEYDIVDDITRADRANTAEITAASASNYYYLDPSQNYIASAQFDTQSWQDVPVLTGVNTFQRTILFYSFLLSAGMAGLGIGSVVKYKQKIKEREK